MALKYTDNCKSTLAAPVLFAGTSITVAAGTGVLWPVLGVGDWTYSTIIDSASPTTFEIVKVTARVIDVLTIIRGIGGVQQAWPSNSKAEIRVCKALLDDLVVGGGGGVTDHGALTGLADDDHPQYTMGARVYYLSMV
jgi:hypothetical protein